MTNLIRRTFAELLTFSRASTGTHFDLNGKLITAAVDQPRFDFDSLTKAPRGLLIEPARTNLLLRSNEFGTAPWTFPNATPVANSINGPDGTLSATRLVETTANSTHQLAQVVTLAAATEHVLSVFAKAGERNTIDLTATSPGMTATTTRFDLSAGTIITGSTGWIEPLKSGWFRISSLIPTVTGGSSTMVLRLYNGAGTYVGNTASGAYFYGAQLEEGGFPSSYIPTLGATANRAIDSATMALSDFWNASEGAIFVSADYIASSAQESATRYAFQIDDGTQDNRISVFNRNGTRNGVTIIADTDTQCAFDGGVAGPARCKIALSWKENAFAFCVDGGPVQTDVLGILPLLTTLRMGHRSVSSGRLGGHVSATYFPTAQTNAELIAYTS